MPYKGIIAGVVPHSIAAETGLLPGDRLIAVNHRNVRDLIDLSFALSDQRVELLVEKQNGQQQLITIEKDYDQDLGIEFESAVFDKIRQCVNHCIFCFVDQMPPGMRESLYIKDDDYRLSFLYGNFITLTNLRLSDMRRIRQLHLSPLYISVHTTNGPLRAKMLGNERAASIMEQINILAANGVEMHTQIVLCPGINNTNELDKTIGDLFNIYPSVLSIAIVPVGLTKFRKNCYPLHCFTAEQARSTISQVNQWQEKSRNTFGNTFVYLADEFYIQAGCPIPAYEYYDGFPQLENGVGIVRNFIEDWKQSPGNSTLYAKPLYIDVVCGKSAEKIIKPLLAELTIPNLYTRLIAVENEFFGNNVTVTGLLTGGDILEQLQQLAGPRTGVIIPGIAFRRGEHVFLDGMTLDELYRNLGNELRIAYNGSDLKELLCNWH
ncbi:MAG TPA: DUF512 domain-containing protein [Methylomusa anaerophila]|uniref:PDZ domain-containing protein n=1 Tax=Methylomusa anaerophila TaxID=1930071 RepID=A0A348APH9_9FIRM|nr:DUF512 domain-containing protein [Methylomusa anaerophila]BBB92977.1 hypothetical protein MAMMFC1_03685 [Methylomusa anaerophila]HML87189.1 DUF512 domain-containing protein [Methylomusa anaerophila]